MLSEISKSFLEVSKRHTQQTLNDEKILNECLWNNYVFTNSIIRYGHIEYFKSLNNKVEVVHVVFWPTPFIDLPVYGFDIIALNGKVTGLFCDLTCGEEPKEIISELKSLNERFIAYKRPLPLWGEFFSKNFLILSPEEKLNEIALCCLKLFRNYLEYNINNLNLLNKQQIRNRIECHNNYSYNQRKNTKTQKALSCYIGEEPSLKFISNVLFPTYN